VCAPGGSRVESELVRIGIDIRHLTDFGVGTYLRNVVRGLARLEHNHQYYLIGDPDRVREIGELPSNFEAVPIAPHDTKLGEYADFRRQVKRCRCDLLHVPHLLAMPQYMLCPYVVTVHDLLDYLYRTRRRNGSSLRRMLHFEFTRRALMGRHGFLRSPNSPRTTCSGCSAFRARKSKWCTTRWMTGSAWDMPPMRTGSLSPNVTR